MFYSPFETKSHYIAHTDLMLTVLPLPGSSSNSALTAISDIGDGT